MGVFELWGGGIRTMNLHYLSANYALFYKQRIAPITLVMSVRVYQRRYHWWDFFKFSIEGLLQKFVNKFHILLNCEQ